MEALLGILFVLLIFGFLITPFIILSKLSALKRSMEELEQDNRTILSHLKKLTQSPEEQQKEAEIRKAETAPKAPQTPTSCTLPLQREPEQPKTTAIPATPPPLPAPAPEQKPAEAPPCTFPLQRESAPTPTSPAKPKSPTPKPTPEIFRKIWRWILVGDESKSKNVSFETAVASTWMMRIGIIFFAGLSAYFLKWSMERELVGPAGRFAIGIGFGITMLLSGIKLLKSRYKIIGEGLLGGGIVVLYLCIYAADVMYHLMPTPLAFALMAGITVTAGFLAVKLDSMLVAIFGIIGGYLTPLALSTTVLSLPGFYTYILILSIAVLVIALVKQWRLLNYLGFILTYGLYFLHSMEHYDKATDFPVAITFLTLLFVVQSLTVCIHNIIRKQQSSVIEAVHLILNALVYSAGGYFLIIEAHGRPWPSIMSLWLALFYLLYIAMFLRRGLKDRTLLLCLISLSAAFTAWTLPLIMEKESLTIALALLAFIFLWLGRKVKSNFLQSLSHIIYGVVFFRIAVMELPGHYSLNAPENATWGGYFKDILDRLFTFGITIGSIAGAFLLSKREAHETNIIFPENDIKAPIPPRTTQTILYWATVIFVFIFLHLEINTMFRCWEPGRLPFLTALWAGLSLFLFHRCTTKASEDPTSCTLSLQRESEEPPSPESSTYPPLKTLTIIVLGTTLIKLIFIDTQTWNLTMDFIYNQDYLLLNAFMRLFDFGIIVALILCMWRLITRGKTSGFSSTQFGYTALALFFLFCTLELRTLLYWKLNSFLPAGISILWALFAVTFIIVGINRNKGSLRATGLVLFTIVCGKVVLSDLQDLSIIYRIIALLVIGITLLMGSFAYLKSGSAEGGNDKL